MQMTIEQIIRCTRLRPPPPLTTGAPPPKTGEEKTLPSPVCGGRWRAAPEGGQRAARSFGSLSAIARWLKVLEPKSSETFTSVSEGVTRGGDKHTLRVDARGRVWATGRPLTVFDPKVGKFHRFSEVPSAYGLTLDKDGNLWFAEYVENGQIGKVDAKSLKVTKWKLPTADGRPRRISFVKNSDIRMDNGLYAGRVEVCKIAYKAIAGREQSVAKNGKLPPRNRPNPNAQAPWKANSAPGVGLASRCS